MGAVDVMLARECLRCEDRGLLYCSKLAFRVDALLVVLVVFACALMTGGCSRCIGYGRGRIPAGRALFHGVAFLMGRRRFSDAWDSDTVR